MRGSEPQLHALLVVSFGGPEGMDDVIPFCENVTRCRNIPRERLEGSAITTSSRSASSGPSAHPAGLLRLASGCELATAA
jgi:hypothetical protein